MNRNRPAALAALALAAGWMTLTTIVAQETARGGLVARLDFFGPAGPPFAYEGDPILMRLSVSNEGSSPWTNDQGIDLPGGMLISRHDGGPIPMKAQKTDARQQPATLAPQGFFGQTFDVTAIAGKALPAGTYSIRWEGAGIASNAFTVRIIPKFDPAARYVAVLETDYGSLEFDLRPDLAPRHVQNFYNLTHQGFYDGTAFHQIIKGVEVRGGDPPISEISFLPYPMEPEVSGEAKHQRGTLSMLRLSGAELDSGTQFLITLAAMPQYDGGLSIFGQLRKGEEVLSAIENIPTTGQIEPPFYRPITPVLLRTISVRKSSGGPGL